MPQPDGQLRPPSQLKIIIAKYPRLRWIVIGYGGAIVLLSVFVLRPTSDWWANSLYGLVFVAVSLGLLAGMLAPLMGIKPTDQEPQRQDKE